MIKYVEFESINETGLHITPINSLYELNKTAAGTYSPELMKVILNMKRQPKRYYAVVNALGSYEYWGCNRNGDAFPESGLKHVSLRTDMGTPNDYGYKTFEYYAKFYLHHVNKNPDRSFGEVIFSHWNSSLHRVELIVAIDTEKAKDIVDALESNTPVMVSMGCRVKYDRCNICDNKAKTREQYCIHLKNHMREVIDASTALKWSRELNRIIKPGIQVCAINDYPRFFDISRVYIGADRTSYILGKAASKGLTILSADIAESFGIKDDDVEKFAMTKKRADIDKEVGSLGPTDMDGSVEKANEISVIRKSIDERMRNTIAAEPELPMDLLDSTAGTIPVANILSTMLGLGIHPTPHEFQRIILIRIGEKPLADRFDENGIVFNSDEDIRPENVDVDSRHFLDVLGKYFLPYLEKRSSFPSFLIPRLTKTASEASDALAIMGYKPSQPAESIAPILTGLAALYAGLKMKAMGYTAKDLADEFITRPWLRQLVGGGVLYTIFNNINKQPVGANDILMRPAYDYAGILRDTNFSGHIKQANMAANVLGTAAIGGAIGYPLAHVVNSYNQRAAMYGKKQLPSISPKSAIIGGAGLAGGGTFAVESILRKIRKVK
jgi:hypothetical protein